MKWNIRELKLRSAGLVSEHHAAVRQTALLYSGVLAALTLGSNGLSIFLDSRIDATGGLDGMGLRSILQTIQQLLYYVNSYFDPFWSAGFLAAMMALVRGRAPESRDLTEGFRRFFRVVGHMAFRWLVTVALGVAAANVGGTLFSMTAAGREFSQAMMPILADPASINEYGLINLELVPQELLLSAVPLVLLVAALFGLMYLYMSYQFRLSLYLVMDRPIGAVQAHFESIRLMRGHKWQMCRLDLSYWWYYLLLAVTAMVANLGPVLSALPLPVDPMVVYFAALAVYCVLFMGLCIWKKSRVDATYVLACEAIAKAEQEETPADE